MEDEFEIEIPIDELENAFKSKKNYKAFILKWFGIELEDIEDEEN